MTKQYAKRQPIVDPDAKAIATNFFSLLYEAAIAHTEKAKYSNKVVRLSVVDGEGGTPFAIHPLWCALTIYHETLLPREIRELATRVLLFHDVLEDTTAELPSALSKLAQYYVGQMTFNHHNDEMKKFHLRGSNEEQKRLLRLFSLYDKTSSLQDCGWSTRANHYAEYALEMCEQVEKDGWGNLNIFTICRALAAKVLAEFNTKPEETLQET